MYKQCNVLFRVIFAAFIFIAANTLTAQTIIRGSVKDANTQEILPGVAISIKGTTVGTISDADGNYELNVSPGRYTLTTSYISYQPLEITDVNVKRGEPLIVDIPMLESEHALNEVYVVAVGRINSEVSLLNSIRKSNAVVSGVSAQQISKSQDRDASEVIRRIPGISILDDKFVVARGLAQRYNNVWVNNSSIPSTEADTRAFSFDIIPSSQIENIMIVKSPQPELPADFSGGFIKVETKGIPSENSIQLSYGIGINTQTQFKNFKYSKSSGTDFLGFDNGMRKLSSVVPSSRMDNENSQLVTDVTKNGFNNDWSVKTKKPIPDQRLGFVINRKYAGSNNSLWGVIAALNYSYTSKTYTDMENSRYGVYDSDNDKPYFTYKYTDNQYNNDARVGAMANLIYMPNDRHRFEFRNMLNQVGRDRYTDREGYQNTSGFYGQRKAEYIYSSRLTYSTQLAGKHTITDKDNLDWVAGFSYANKNQPDRRIINWEQNGYAGDAHYMEYQVDQNDITRDFNKLNEYNYSLTANYVRDFSFDNGFKPSVKVGAYTEYRDRDYNTRYFKYRWIPENLPDDFSYRDVVSQILIPENYASDKLFVYDDTDRLNDYSGTNTLIAGYLGFNIPLNKFNIYAGARIENNKMSLKSYTTIKGDKSKTTDYDYTDIFPSINASYNITKDQLVRLAYGRSTNRQEFREVSPSSYYDFDLFSFVSGNPDLKPAYANNFDLRYEFYPSSAEVVSFALFYKRFSNPIEWTYLDGGGTYIYTFRNANTADNYGVELDVKKNLEFVGLKDLSLTFNGALIKSEVKFIENTGANHDRPMQGQSPFLVNTGLFYQNDKLGLTSSLLYNIIGKRIVGIGRVSSSEGSTINNDIPDMYEMPRNVVDFMVTKKFGPHFELNAGIKDILAQKVKYKQFPKFIDENGNTQEREQTTKEYKPGRNITLTARYTF
ncbi:TonB-dependent receptor [Dysgonomonas sp. PFB1-18]|uniref:TonB-dependent receptor n=1 Tax=unclassified Dysgonomonas TaxID=2630389 RepID=UPI0024732F77|nr:MULTISPECIES: TonB-dependent receptor [unclassified Dysgonomonas]MDH6308750.1 TonB-dependent receptor [Dysgonomonas sp. PF1-14]MDH6338553.1 TonB-dependent receptor [Dysgonomonas sp. PF1-16]MDH6379999.1 TonB-dependent receptor [Dysgonomonas sp. PFB1-18]MDH6397381.1 TonB-dependent receptor [Dysgonomonas sp. PF1-23]